MFIDVHINATKYVEYYANGNRGFMFKHLDCVVQNQWVPTLATTISAIGVPITSLRFQ